MGLGWDLSGQETVHSEFVVNFQEQILNQSPIAKTCERKLKCQLNKSAEMGMSFWKQSSQHKYQRIEEPRNVNLNVIGTFIFCKSHLSKTAPKMTEWYLEKWRSDLISSSWIFARPKKLKVEQTRRASNRALECSAVLLVLNSTQLRVFKAKNMYLGTYPKRSFGPIKCLPGPVFFKDHHLGNIDI